MINHWEEFEAGPTEPKGSRLHVTLNFKGQILLNKVAVEAIGEPKAVSLFFDKVNSLIGIRPANALAKKPFPLKASQTMHSRRIYASPFCKNYNIRTEGTIAFFNIDIDKEGMMILDLTKTSKISRPLRSAANR